MCSIVLLPSRKLACSFLSFDSTPLRLLSITILPRTLLTTDSNVIPRQFLHSFRFPPFDRQFDNQSFPPFSRCLLVSLHYVYDLLYFSSSVVNVTFKRLRCMLSIPGAFPFFRCPMAFLTSALLGSDVSISSISFGSSISISLTVLLGFSLFSTSEKCSNHRLSFFSYFLYRYGSCLFCSTLSWSFVA